MSHYTPILYTHTLLLPLTHTHTPPPYPHTPPPTSPIHTLHLFLTSSHILPSYLTYPHTPFPLTPTHTPFSHTQSQSTRVQCTNIPRTRVLICSNARQFQDNVGLLPINALRSKVKQTQVGVCSPGNKGVVSCNEP